MGGLPASAVCRRSVLENSAQGASALSAGGVGEVDLPVGPGGEGAKFWLQALTELKYRGVHDV
jgi:hypothetical protein